MAFKFGKAAQAATPASLPAPQMLDDSKESDRIVEQQTRINEANLAAHDELLDMPESAEIDAETLERIDNPQRKLSKLVSSDFPWDESQREAIDGLKSQQYGCLTGAAGTGKTTVTKGLVDEIQDELGAVDMTKYFKQKEGEGEPESDDPDDEYQVPEEKIVPSICLAGFTGRSSQMIKKNFPRDWHGNIMTIHRMLGYYPEYYDEWDDEAGDMRTKMRFVPLYNENLKLPWDVIVLDEAGMISVDLWEKVWVALKPGCRVIMIGDINQLPPVHGRSIFGFAMTKWPSWELTHIHRQVGVNNSIVDNAWKILKGYKPESDDYKVDPDWKFAMMPISEDSVKASQQVRAWLARMNGKAYQPHRDTVITAINGEDTSRGYALGQIPMNRELAIVFNRDNPRYIIDAGRERKQFAVDDKVMATKNDHEAGITNGMTGIITEITRNEDYAGDPHRFGLVSEVAKYLEDVEEDEDEFSLEDVANSLESSTQGKQLAGDKRDRGPASHTVTVRFGEGEHAFEIPFRSLAEVASLMTAYVVTCHKMQGGESPLVIVILHQAHKAMLDREWLYTAVTRASGKCVLFFTELGLRAALSKQRITGKTLKEKIKVFVELQTKGMAGAAIQINSLPDPVSLRTDIEVAVPRTMAEIQEEKQEVRDENKVNPFLKQIHAKIKPEVRERIIVVEREVHHHHTVEVHHANTATEDRVVKDAGELKRDEPSAYQVRLNDKLNRMMKQMAPKAHPLPAPKPKLPIAAGPVVTHHQTTRPEPLRLTHQPMQATEGSPPATPAPKKPFRFGVK